MQLPMFYETYDDAIRETVMGLGGMKVVGNMLWPALPVDDAGRKLSHCLNVEKREKLSPGELQLIRRHARKAGVHILAFYEARDAGYTEPTPTCPENELSELHRRYIQAVDDFKDLASRMEQVAQRARSNP